MKNRFLIIIGLLGFVALSAFAGGGPCNYIVLYDQTDTNSVAVANYYQQVRNIPERNMVPYTFFPTNKTSYTTNDLWSLTLYLRQVIQNRGLTGRFNGIAVAGTVPLLSATDRLCFQAGLYYAPNLTGAGAYSDYVSDNFAYAVATNPITREIRDDKPFIKGSVTNVYWPVSFVGFTGVNGNTPDEVFALMDRSKAADGLRPDGVVYWPTNGNIRSTTRAGQIKTVAPIWNAKGIRYFVSDGGSMSIDNGQPDIAGVVGGTAQADCGISGNTYLPGAWTDHLTSNGGNLNSLINGQSSACAWLRAGAYGSSGTCAEPYAIAAKFPHANIHTHLRAGASQAEAFWQSLQTPYEIVMVGDPLLQAWSQIPQVTISSPADGAILSGTAAINASALTTSPDGLETQYELAVDGHIVRIGSTNEPISATWTGSGFMLDTATLADGWHDVRVLAYNNNAIHTQGEARRTVFVNNSSQSITLTGPSALEYTSNGTFTVSLSGIANATNVTIQANGRTLATLSSGGSTNLSASLFGYKGVTKLYALAWLNNGKQVWSAPLNVNLSWAPTPAVTNVALGASIARIRYFSDTTATNFDWDVTSPDGVTNFAGPMLTEGFKALIDYRSYSVDTNVFAPASYAGKPGIDSAMYFLAPVEGLYEFMIDDTSITNILMEVDGQRIQHGIHTSEGNIKPVPVKLAAGLHPVRLRFQATAANYLAELWYRGGISPGNINATFYSNILVSRMNEFVCFGPAETNNAAPVITSGPSSTLISTTKALLSVGATDPDGNTNLLVYSWAKIDGPGSVAVPTNATGSCYTNQATFNRAGSYRLRVVVSDGSSVATGEVTTVIDPVYSTVSVSPTDLTMRAGASVQLYAVQKDQFTTYSSDRPFVWTLQGGGTITSNGLYTAPSTSGTNKVIVSSGSYSATNTIVVLDNFAPVISSATLKNYGDYLQCTVTATDDMDTGRLTYMWEPVGVQPGTITFSPNSTTNNSANGYFTRFGTYSLRVGATDSGGATTWSNKTITVGPTINGVTLIETNIIKNGRIDANESVDLFVKITRGADYGTNLPVSAVLSVTNTPGLSVIQANSAYPTNLPVMSVSSNLVPFRLSADGGLIDNKPRDLILTVTIGGASGDLPFSLVGGEPYSLTQTAGAAIVPGTNDVGVHVPYYGGTNVALPFVYNFGSQNFTSVFVNANGVLQFSSTDIYSYFGTLPTAGFTNIIAVCRELLRLDLPGCGIFTSVSGIAPNRIFNIEWRALTAFYTNEFVNCEARLYEAQPRVDMIYGILTDNGADATVGLQVNPVSYNLFSYNQAVLTNGLQLSYILKTTNGVPSASFSATPTAGWVPLAVSFTDASTGDITNRFWDFGDGITTNTLETVVSHTYNSTGNKTLQLIVSGPDGVSTNTQVDCIRVTMPVAPSAGFTASTNAGIAPLSVTFTDTSAGSITNRFWDFGDGSTTNTTATSVAHTYASAGTNTVQLIVSGPLGVSTNTQIAAVTVTLPAAPVAGFSATPTSGTAPLTVIFTDTSTGSITNRYWSFGDGGTTNTTATSVAHTYTSAGTNTVQLIVSGPGGASTNTQANLISATAAPAGSLYFYDGFDYSAGTSLSAANTANAWTLSGAAPAPTNRADSLVYAGLPSSTGGKLELAGYRTAGAGTSYRSQWDGTTQPGLNGTNLFASFLLNVQSIGTSQSNSASGNYVFSLRSSAKECLVISNNANNAANFNIGLENSSGQAINGWDTGAGGNGYAAGTTLFIVMSYTNSAADGSGTWGSQVWINPVLSAALGAANLSAGLGTTAYAYQRVNIGNGNGVYDSAQRAVIYMDELRVGSTWGSVVPSAAPPASKYIEVSTNTLDITEGTTNSVQIRLSSQPASDVTVNISRISGETNIQVISPSVIFAAANWNVWQPVYIAALVDADTNNGTAIIQLSDAGGAYTSTNILATQIDATVIADSNGNGIPDSWEIQYFGGITNINPAALAANGINTILEAYIAGLNPTSAQSVWTLSLQSTASQKMLQWSAVSGRVYSVYWTTNLLTGFQPLETNLVWPQSSWTDTVNGAQGGGYYRVSVRLNQ